MRRVALCREILYFVSGKIRVVDPLCKTGVTTGSCMGVLGIGIWRVRKEFWKGEGKIE